MPQPIDPQTEIGRATAAERIQQIADRSSLAAQARATETSANTLRNLETQVQQAKARSDEVDQDLPLSADVKSGTKVIRTARTDRPVTSTMRRKRM